MSKLEQTESTRVKRREREEYQIIHADAPPPPSTKRVTKKRRGGVGH